MKSWEEFKDSVNEVSPDTEMAGSILRMMTVRLAATKSLDKRKFASIVTEGYYEVIKEGITALMAIGGYKTLSHEALVAYLKEFYNEFSEQEIRSIDQLRQLRNKIVYKGFFVQEDYIKRNEKLLEEIIGKMKRLIAKKL